MKNIKLFVGLLLIVIVGCTNDSMEEVNKDYNALSEVNPIFLINGTLATLVAEDFQIEDWGHHVAYKNFNPGLYENFDATTPWNEIYLANKNLLEVIKSTSKKETLSDRTAHAMALVIRSTLFITLTDAYGDVPYSEAGFEDENGIIETPIYDKQKDIYLDCFEKLTEALELIGESDKILLGEADYIYKEDLQKWKVFANTVRLRMALRISNVDSGLSEKWFDEVAKFPIINSHEQSAKFERFDEAGYRNPLWTSTVHTFFMSKLMVDFLKDTNDPRLALFAKPNANNEYVGLENGRDFVDIALYSRMGDELSRADRATPILLYDEVCFIKAEMYLRGLGGVQDQNLANEWYQKGIRASMENYNIEEFTISNYLLNNPFATLNGNEEDMKEQIGVQKWLANIQNGYESYADMRRSGYPIIADRINNSTPEVSLGETKGKLPRRLKYPDNEMFYNSVNYNKAREATDGNSFLARMWWDVK
ncbi:SusD/RagB family nutrient-binding outer membrane lipoprotein [Arenibacter certesii]|uniref:SusD/RagB family nutrient-binding outer membrane lipoprotein n=1 Tax=Arenibacter certesii TaxID=228955 RepID=A0A918J792_9FLAO|nr:SusD/RagB family nutrient-binding outer membrane lipoprotein [Arenibacter certesii]GGW48506.1 hypothetical protein GCM10007383_35720 [Arenibacter certesii]